MYREENNHKLCFSQADTTAKYHKFAYRDTATSFLYKNKLPRVASRALPLSETVKIVSPENCS